MHTFSWTNIGGAILWLAIDDDALKEGIVIIGVGSKGT